MKTTDYQGSFDKFEDVDSNDVVTNLCPAKELVQDCMHVCIFAICKIIGHDESGKGKMLNSFSK